jgi:hypothetical protein
MTLIDPDAPALVIPQVKETAPGAALRPLVRELPSGGAPRRVCQFSRRGERVQIANPAVVPRYLEFFFEPSSPPARLANLGTRR